eukprot:CAMPEP_0201632132 /NCGR_PEP_ID=MMETSP0493-20130528/5871_1 /ASSEMBLY_ACC=CAM_ASM_000838 /TAXON_ID=420259 /ORGANISM="Thalassiosira gravida, Strain GMp14c1" /LENGTH=150 /DNA_ID=CAMNT_0048103587 /DNA_START=89 /DNA_END=541 /DNA_ORIENTATION=+
MPLSIPSRSLLSICLLVLGSTTTSIDGLAVPSPQNPKTTNNIIRNNNNSRRAFLSTTATSAFFATLLPQRASARYVLNDETGEYDEIPAEAWQSAWGKRLEKAKSMSTEDVFLAAQGAGNLDTKNAGEESEASKKKRVIGGDYQFMVDAM